MEIIVFGATGRVGSRLVEYCLQANHQVTAFVRDSSKASHFPNDCKIFVGDVKDSGAVLSACEGKDVILSALSGRSTKPDYSVLSIAMRNYILAAEKHRISRILYVAGAGVLLDPEFGLRRNRPGYPSFFRAVSEENLKVLDRLDKSNLHWTCVAAPEMPEGNRTKKYRVQIDYLPENGNRISVEDVADFLVENISTEKYFQKKVGICY
jgi:putative NADH-flavin reductase